MFGKMSLMGALALFISWIPNSDAIAEGSQENRSLIIENYEKQNIDQRIIIPLSTVEFVSNLLPEKVKADLAKEGISIETILKAAQDKEFKGILAIIEKPEENEKTVVSIK